MKTTLGEIAYDGYRFASDGKSLVTGQPIPTWDGLSPEVQAAWEAAAEAVTDYSDNFFNAGIELVPDTQGGHIVFNGRVWRPETK